jgi:hypothetical protein
MISATEWAVTLPNPASAREGADALTRALEDAHATIREVANRFSGTLPPPPWPADPELLAAMKKAEQLADGMDVIAKNAPEQKWHSGSKPYDVAKAAGVALLEKAAALKARADGLPAAADPATLIPKLAKKAAAPLLNLGGSTFLWLGVGLLIWDLTKGGRRDD